MNKASISWTRSSNLFKGSFVNSSEKNLAIFFAILVIGSLVIYTLIRVPGSLFFHEIQHSFYLGIFLIAIAFIFPRYSIFISEEGLTLKRTYSFFKSHYLWDDIADIRIDNDCLSIDLDKLTVNHFPGLEKKLLEEILLNVRDFFDHQPRPVTPSQDQVAEASSFEKEKSIDPFFVEISSGEDTGILKMPNRRKSYTLTFLILGLGLSLFAILNLTSEASAKVGLSLFSLASGIILGMVALNELTQVHEADWDEKSVRMITKSIFSRKLICSDWDSIHEFKLGKAYRPKVGPVYFIHYAIGGNNSIFAYNILERQASHAAEFLERKRLEIYQRKISGT